MKREELGRKLDNIKSQLKESREKDIEREFAGCLDELGEHFNNEDMDKIKHILDGLEYGVKSVIDNYNDYSL